MEKEGMVLMLSILWPNKCCIGNNRPIQWSLFCLAIDSIFSSFPMMHGTVVILRDNWTPNLYWISSITILLMEHEETGWLALKQSFSLNLMINVSFTHSKNMSQVPTMCLPIKYLKELKTKRAAFGKVPKNPPLSLNYTLSKHHYLRHIEVFLVYIPAHLFSK